MTSLLALALHVAFAQAPEPYPTAVRLIDDLYLEPDEVTPTALLKAAARELSDEIPWLFVKEDGAAVLLTHGGGKLIARIEATTMEELPATLHALEQSVATSGHAVPDGVDLRLAVLDGMTGALDRYSRVLSGDGLDRFDVRLKGTMVGIGVGLEWQGHDLIITRVDPGGPASSGGVRVGDAILRIDGRSTTSMALADASALIRGDPNTQVVLSVRRQARSGSAETTVTLDLALTRDEIVLPNVTHRVLDDAVGYVHIEHVSQQTVANLQGALAALRAEGALEKGLVIDLRGNTGGSMKEAARAADVFLHSGLLLRTVGHDGQRVQNLEAEMRAIDAGDEPQIPVVLVVDDRTASGAEILAGALLEHDRTVLVGSPTYGKGTVQKIYTLDDDTRLKLTVARYLLANDRQILPAGIVPDGLVAQITLDEHGQRLDPAASPTGTPASVVGVAVEVVEKAGWRGNALEGDLALEVARRTALHAPSFDRPALLDTLANELAWANLAQETRLAEAMRSRGLDWSPADAEGSFPEADVAVATRAPRGGSVPVAVEVTNRGADPLHRVVVELDSDGAGSWTGWSVPLGRIEPGATAKGEVLVPIRPGAAARDDAVTPVVRAHLRPPLRAPDGMLSSEGTPVPEPSLSVRLVPHGGRTGPHGHPVYRAELSITNESREPLHGLEVTFGYPADERVELMDRSARLPLLPGGRTERVDLALEIGPHVERLQLEVQLTAERFGRLLSWPLPLSTDGTAVALRAPHVEPPRRRTLPTGPQAFELDVRDDGRVADVELWVNYRKLHWFPGTGSTLAVQPTIPLLPGNNTVVVVARDEQGLRTQATWVLRGEEPTSAVAEP